MLKLIQMHKTFFFTFTERPVIKIEKQINNNKNNT